MPFCLHVLLLLSTTAFPSSNLDLARVREEQRQRVEVFAKAAESVVLIYPNAAREGGGSGVLIDADGYGVTNFHVVAEFVQQGGYGALADGKLYPLTVLGIDPGGDVAMFKLEGRDEFPFAPFGPKSLPRLGQTVAAMGNPFVLSENYDPTISMGVISGLHRYQEGQENLLEYADCIQVSTSINPGNSGGPLFDLDGHVIGINGRASFEERGRVNVGLGYAITTQQIKRFIPALRAGLLTQHGTLGATVQLAGDDLIVDAIQQLSPAERVGIEIGDVVVAIQGQPVRTPNEYNNVVAPMPADWPVTVTLKRGNTDVEVSARLEALPIRMQTPLVPNTRLQHDAVRRYFTKFRAEMRRDGAREGGRNDPQTMDVETFSGNTARIVEVAGEIASGAADSPLPIRITFGPDATEVQTDFADKERIVAFAEALHPLFVTTDIGFGWTVRGGDQLGDRIVGVVEEGVVNGATTRWCFDDATGRILKICTRPDDEAGETCWTTCEAADGFLPECWIQENADSSVRLTLQSIQVKPSAASEE